MSHTHYCYFCSCLHPLCLELPIPPLSLAISHSFLESSSGIPSATLIPHPPEPGLVPVLYSPIIPRV